MRFFYILLILLAFNFPSKAQALVEASCDVGVSSNSSLIDLQKVGVAASESNIHTLAWSCTKEFFMGAWDSTGGEVGDAVDCVTSPIDCANSAVQGAKNAWNFVKDFSHEISRMYESLSHLGPQQKLDLICQMVGSIGTSVAIGILTAGAGSALAVKVIAKLTLKISKLGRILKTGLKVSHRKLGDLSDAVLEKVDELVHHGYSRVVIEALEACPI